MVPMAWTYKIEGKLPQISQQHLDHPTHMVHKAYTYHFRKLKTNEKHPHVLIRSCMLFFNTSAHQEHFDYATQKQISYNKNTYIHTVLEGGDGEKSSRHEFERHVLILYLHSKFTKDVTEAKFSDIWNSISPPQPEMHWLKNHLTATHVLRKSSHPEKDGPLLTLSWNFDFGMAISKMWEIPFARALIHNDSSLKERKRV